MGGFVFVLFFLLFFVRGNRTINPAGEPASAGECANEVHYFRHDLAENDNRFGEGFDWPAWQADLSHDLNKDGVVDVRDVQIDLHNRRCVDPALVVAHSEYAARSYSSPAERLAKTQALVNDREQWRWTVIGLEAREATATKVEVVQMCDPYRTLYMVNTEVPQIYQDALDRPCYWVFRFIYADGSQDNYKLDCGYQPVEPEFPGVPGPPGGSPPSPTCPPTVCKGPAPASPPPCVDSSGNVCTQQPGAGGSPGNGGAVDHGDDGYSPSDPPPPTVVPPAPPPSSVVTLPPTTAPPPPTSLVIPG
jgi:hypothetical protein